MNDPGAKIVGIAIVAVVTLLFTFGLLYVLIPRTS